MRGAVESRRLVQLDGVNAGGVVAVAWAISSFMAGLAGVLLAPVFGTFQSDDLRHAHGGGHRGGGLGSAALDAHRRRRRRADRRGQTTPAGLPAHRTACSTRPCVPVAPLLRAGGVRCSSCPACAALDSSRDPLATIDPPPPPTAAASRAPSMDRIIRVAVVRAARGLHRLHAHLDPQHVGGRLQLRPGAVHRLALHHPDHRHGGADLPVPGHAGRCGAFTAAQLANHLGLNMLVGGLIGAVLAAVVAVILALLSLRLRGLGLALMTLAAALLFDDTFFNATPSPAGPGIEPCRPSGWAPVSSSTSTAMRSSCSPWASHRLCHRGPAGAQGDGGAESGRHAGQRDGRGRTGHQPRPGNGSWSSLWPAPSPARWAAWSPFSSRWPIADAMELRVLARLRRAGGHHRGVDGGGGHPGRRSGSS